MRLARGRDDAAARPFLGGVRPLQPGPDVALEADAPRRTRPDAAVRLAVRCPPRFRFTVRWMMVALVGVSLLCASVAAWRGAHGPVPLARSVYLHGLVEPIRMERGVSYSDGGSLGLRFLDARGTSRSVCLAKPLDTGLVYLVLGSDSDTGARGWSVPLTSDEARALLGLLDRWSASRASGGGYADRIASGILDTLRSRN